MYSMSTTAIDDKHRLQSLAIFRASCTKATHRRRPPPPHRSWRCCRAPLPPHSLPLERIQLRRPLAAEPAAAGAPGAAAQAAARPQRRPTRPQRPLACVLSEVGSLAPHTASRPPPPAVAASSANWAHSVRSGIDTVAVSAGAVAAGTGMRLARSWRSSRPTPLRSPRAPRTRRTASTANLSDASNTSQTGPLRCLADRRPSSAGEQGGCRAGSKKKSRF